MKKILTLLLTTLCLSSFAQVDLDKNLEAFLPFNGNANDESTNSNNGTTSGVELIKDRFGNDNSAYEFAQDSDYIQLPLIFSTTSNVSVAFWVKSNVDVGGGFMVMNGNPRKFNGFGVREAGTNNCDISTLKKVDVIFPGDDCNALNSTYEFPVDEWTFVCYTRTATTASLYINAQLKHSGNTTNGDAPTDQTMIGFPHPEGTTNSTSIKGAMDDFRFYSRVINQDEIDALYEDKSTSSVYSVNIAAQTSVYPNPSNGTFNVELPKQGANLTLVNAQGVTVKQFNNFSGTKLQVANLPKGMYILQTELDGYTAYRKLIVQ